MKVPKSLLRRLRFTFNLAAEDPGAMTVTHPCSAIESSGVVTPQSVVLHGNVMVPTKMHANGWALKDESDTETSA